MAEPDSQSEQPRDTGSSTSRSMLERLKGEDEIAWRELVQLYSPLIIYWTRRQGAHERDCEDILQDVFRTVATNITKFSKDKPSSTFRGWLRTITRSRIADHYRQSAREPNAAGGTDAHLRFRQLTESVVESDANDRTAERELFLRAIALIRKEFKERTWQAFWRTAVDGCSVQEVADELNMQPGTVRVAKSRVLQRLRGRLGDLLE